jgi:hypothetical protein
VIPIIIEGVEEGCKELVEWQGLCMVDGLVWDDVGAVLELLVFLSLAAWRPSCRHGSWAGESSFFLLLGVVRFSLEVLRYSLEVVRFFL